MKNTMCPIEPSMTQHHNVKTFESVVCALLPVLYSKPVENSLKIMGFKKKQMYMFYANSYV